MPTRLLWLPLLHIRLNRAASAALIGCGLKPFPLPCFAAARSQAKSPSLVLLLLAVVTGSLAGLMLVFSVNLPQINDLERYRPSTMTDLYDRKGRIIGSFALEKTHRRQLRRLRTDSSPGRHLHRRQELRVSLGHQRVPHRRARSGTICAPTAARRAPPRSPCNWRAISSSPPIAPPPARCRRLISPSRSSAPSPRSRSLRSTATRSTSAAACTALRPRREFYFSKHAKDLTLTEAALLAGLPKGPVAYSPLINPEKALRRRNLVLSEMESDGVITHQQAEQARRSPLGLHINQPEMSVAPWFQEEVRRELEKKFGAEQVHEAGLRVDTTLDLDLQKTANKAVTDGLAAYERRHGWKGKLENVLANGTTLEDYKHPDWAIASHPGDYVHALVTRSLPLEIRARVGANEVILLPADWAWTGQRYGDALVKPGDVIYVHLTDASEGGAERATLEQDSGTQGAVFAMDNTTGDVLAMVGGRDYALSEFNRATQAERQTGSSFKPYVYTTAIEDGAKPDDIIVDAPVNFGGYAPHNYENDYKGRDDPDQRLCRIAQRPRRQTCRARRYPQGHRHGASLRRHIRHTPISAHRARRGRNHSGGTGHVLLRFSQ